MAIINFIPEKSILPTAFRLVEKSKKTLYLTMILKEELKTTSDEYLALIRRKILEGVLIKRIGFGSQEDYEKGLAQLGVRLSKNFYFKHCPDLRKAQRLLISDKKEMIFAVYIDRKRKVVFYTRYKPLIRAFVAYFKEVFRNSTC